MIRPLFRVSMYAKAIGAHLVSEGWCAFLSVPSVVTFFHFFSVGRSEKLRASRAPWIWCTV